MLIANSLSLLLYNVAGMFVTEELGAVSRTVFESARTLFVWLGDLLLYYTHTGLGEKWDNSSYLQACVLQTSFQANTVQFCKPCRVPGWGCPAMDHPSILPKARSCNFSTANF